MNELEMAILVAKANPRNPILAGWHIGLVLHAVQDRKHEWCSCGPSSNPRTGSANGCGSSRNGCPAGFGNHGLQGCIVPLMGYNFQRDTDHNPRPAQLDRALKDSVEVRRSFVAQTK
jgi:hypothetical protein